MSHSAADRRAAQRRRELNLLIASISEEKQVTTPIGLGCECGHQDCWETLPFTPAQFAALQSRGGSVLAPAHRVRATPETVYDEREPVASGRAHRRAAHQMSSPRVSTS